MDCLPTCYLYKKCFDSLKKVGHPLVKQLGFTTQYFNCYNSKSYSVFINSDQVSLCKAIVFNQFIVKFTISKTKHTLN